jgi:hypothetical protein
MRTLKQTLQILSVFLLIIGLSLPTGRAAADDGGEGHPWANVFDEEGHLLDNLTDLGEVEVEADWMDLGIPGVLEINPTFHQFVTASGEMLLVPSASTLFFMGLHPVESGLIQAYGALQNGQGMAITGASLLLHLINQTVNGQDLLAQIDEFGYTDPAVFMDEFIHNQDQIWTFAGTDVLNLLMELMTIGFSDEILATTYLLYLKGDCTSSPTGCPEDLCLVAPQACEEILPANASTSPDAKCPAATITVGTPLLTIIPVAPERPLVTGQDPARRGVDIQISAVIPPTIQVVYQAVPVHGEVQRCILGGTGAALDCTTQAGLTAYNGTWQSVREVIRMECQRRVNTFPEPIAALSAWTEISQTSRTWILNELGAYYPGAGILAGSIGLVPGMASAQGGCGGDKVCRASALISQVQFQDPGQHLLHLRVQTAGTPLTQGRILTGYGQVEVGFIAVRLIQVGSQ